MTSRDASEILSKGLTKYKCETNWHYPHFADALRYAIDYFHKQTVNIPCDVCLYGEGNNSICKTCPALPDDPVNS